MKKRFLAITIILSMTGMLFVGCGEKKTEEEEMKSEKKKIGVCMINYTNPFYTTYLDVAKEAADELGYEIIANSAEDSLENEVAIIENYVQQGVDAILFDAIEPKGVTEAVSKAVDADIPIMSIFNPIDAGGNYSCSYEHKIGFKSVTVAVAEKLGKQGKICVIQGGIGNYASDQRTEGFEEAISNYPNIEVLDMQPCDWDPSKAVEIVQNWLTAYDDIDAILCMTDGATPSIAEVVQTSGKDILVAGNDGEKEVLEMMEDGQVVADTLLGSKRGAWLSMLYLDQILNGKDVENVVYIPSYLVADQELLDQMENDGVDLSWIATATPEKALELSEGYKEEFKNYFE